MYFKLSGQQMVTPFKNGHNPNQIKLLYLSDQYVLQFLSILRDIANWMHLFLDSQANLW